MLIAVGLKERMKHKPNQMSGVITAMKFGNTSKVSSINKDTETPLLIIQSIKRKLWDNQIKAVIPTAIKTNPSSNCFIMYQFIVFIIVLISDFMYV